MQQLQKGTILKLKGKHAVLVLNRRHIFPYKQYYWAGTGVNPV